MPAVAPRVAGQAERSSSALEDRSEGGARRPRAGHRWWPVSARSSRLSARQEVGPLPPSRICLRPVHRHPSPALGLFLESNIFSWSLLTFPSCPMRKRRHSRLGAQAAGLLQGHGHGRDPRAGDSVPFKTPSQKEALPGHPCAKCLRCRCRGGEGNSFSSAPQTGMAFTC